MIKGRPLALSDGNPANGTSVFASRCPRVAGYCMPGEWTPHARCWMSWPHRPEVFHGSLGRTQRAYAAVAQAIRRFEPVTMIAHPDGAESARRLCGPDIDILAIPIDDSWSRDNGPAFLRNNDGAIAGTAWRFNAWGGKFEPYGDDALLGARLIRHLGVPLYRSPLTLEGGAIHVDGEGTLLTTETAILNDNRNPGWTKAEAEAELRRGLGVEKVVWLPGDDEEYITDGHIDGFACFVRPGVVLFETNPDRQDPHHPVLVENLKALAGATDAKGRAIEVVPIEEAYESEPTSEYFCRSYVNFYIANGGIVMPAYGTPGDARAKAVVGRMFADREVVQVDIRDIARGGGGIHCITQQQPA